MEIKYREKVFGPKPNFVQEDLLSSQLYSQIMLAMLEYICTSKKCIVTAKRAIKNWNYRIDKQFLIPGLRQVWFRGHFSKGPQLM